MLSETDFDKTLHAIQTAIQMEIDGKKFYLASSQESENDLGKKLLQSLAAEEDLHRAKFEQIYNELRVKKAWPEIKLEGDGGKNLRTIFAKALEKPFSQKQPVTSEVDAIKIAINMEIKTYEFYKERSIESHYTPEKEFYDKLAGIEREHHLILVDYAEYLRNPAGWFTGKEHHSLDAG